MKKNMLIFALMLVVSLSANAKEQKFYTSKDVQCEMKDGLKFCKDLQGRPFTGTIKEKNSSEFLGGKTVTEVTSFKNGVFDGSSKVYDDKQTLRYLTDYSQGVTIKAKSFWSNGKVCAILKGNNIKAYYKNGNMMYQKDTEGDVFFNKKGEKLVESGLFGQAYCTNKGQKKVLSKEKIDELINVQLSLALCEEEPNIDNICK